MSTNSKLRWRGLLVLILLIGGQIICHAQADNTNKVVVGPDLPLIHVSGFMQSGGQQKVLLVVRSENPDPHGQHLISYLTLAEHEKQTVAHGAKLAEIEVVKAYPEQGKVDLVNAGTRMTLYAHDADVTGQAPLPPQTRFLAPSYPTAVFHPPPAAPKAPSVSETAPPSSEAAPPNNP